MKGFVPVTKESLLAMLVACEAVTHDQYDAARDNTRINIIKAEEKRANTRRWYRLWQLPKPRFDYSPEAVIEWSGKQEYGLFEGCPFKMLDADLKNTIRWINSLKKVATSNYAGEPIQLDMVTFKQINSPELYRWVSTSSFYTIRA